MPDLNETQFDRHISKVEQVVDEHSRKHWQATCRKCGESSGPTVSMDRADYWAASHHIDNLDK